MQRKRRLGRRSFGYYKNEREVIKQIKLKRRKRRGSKGPTSYGQIAWELNAEGYQTQTGKDWRTEQVRRILNNTG